MRHLARFVGALLIVGWLILIPIVAVSCGSG
jgi:hypothetical protein